MNGEFGIIHMDLVTKVLTPGCCADQSCTPETCMKLPAGQTCGGCAHWARCNSMFGAQPENTICDFYPRAFQAGS